MTASETEPTVDPASRDLQLEQLLKEVLGYVPDLVLVEVEAIDMRASEAVQVRSEGLDDEAVERYTDAITNGQVLPAGFGDVNGETWRVTVRGGMHRIQAMIRQEADLVPMYLIMPGHHPESELLQLSIRHNTAHGVPLSNEDRAAQAVRFMEDYGWSASDAAKMVGLSQVTVGFAWSETKGRRRASEIGCVRDFDALTATVRRKISQSLLDADQDVFEETVITARQARVNSSSVDEFLAGVRAAADAEEALLFLEDYHTERIPTGGRGVNHSASARQLAAKVADLDPDAIARHTMPDYREQTVDLIKRAARRLAEVAIAIERLQ